MSLRPSWEAAAHLIAENRAWLEMRSFFDALPAWPSDEWASFLLRLTDGQLDRLEGGGNEAVWPKDTPPSLLALNIAARHVCASIPVLPADGVEATQAARKETPQKRAQIDAFVHAITPILATAPRVVDVGSGHGHLTRDIARRLAVPVVGLEREPRLAERARSLSSDASPAFAVTDVLRDGLPLVEGDVVLGLHACGELGDRMACEAARCHASLALVGCCLQKRRATARPPLCSSNAIDGAALSLPRSLLGLSNLTARDDGVEASRLENLAGRQRRLALLWLLSRETDVPWGSEIQGLNRRAARGDLTGLVARAFAVRKRPMPSERDIDAAEQWAAREHARARRLSLPRAQLARVLEIFVLLDRALYLEEHGFAVTVGTLFSNEVSARNLLLLARI